MATITQVRATTLDGYYKAGSTITIEVVFDEAVTVTGSPTLLLETGITDRTALYSGGSGSDTLSFSYVIQSGDDAADLAYVATDSLISNGGTIKNGSNQNADLTLPTLGSAISLSGSSNIVVDTEAPVFDYTSGIADTPGDGASQAIGYYFLSFSDNLTASNDLVLTQTAGLDDGSQSFPVMLSHSDGLANGSQFFPIGTTTNIFTLTDQAGNIATINVDITVSDYEQPVAVVVDSYQVLLDGSGTATLNVLDLDNGSYDNDDRGIANYYLLTEPDTSAEGEVDHLTFTLDNSDNPSVFKVRVVGYNTLGEVVLNNLNEPINFTYTPATDDDPNNNSNLASPILLNLGFRVYDPSNNFSSATTGNSIIVPVTISDGAAPVAIAQTGVQLALGADGTITLTADNFDNGSSDNLGFIASMAIASDRATAEQIDASTLKFDVDDLGSQAITLTVTDSSGLVGIDTETITIVDLIAPTALALGTFDLELGSDGNATLSVTDINNGSSDNTPTNTLLFSLDRTAFTAADVNQNFTVTLSVTDVYGNESTDTSIVSVVDRLDPTVLAQNFEVILDTNGEAIVSFSDLDAGSTDNVGIATTTLTYDGTTAEQLTFTTLGTKIVTLTVTDISGNIGTTTAQVLVKETTPPVVNTQNIVVELGVDGTGTITVDDIDNGSYDPDPGSGIQTRELSQYSFSGINLGSNSVTLTVTDNSGNVSSAIATVTVEDHLAPVFSQILGNITVEADAVPETNGIILTALDNVDGLLQATAVDVRIDGATPHYYTLNRTWTVTDNQGNTATQVQVITVQDTIAPTVLTQDITVGLDATGMATITAADINNGSFDNVGTVALSLDITSFDGSDLGPNTVTLIVIDEDGNSNTGTAIVTVVDNILPVAIADNFTLELDATGNGVLSINDVNNGSSDNDLITSLELSQTDFSLADIQNNPNNIVTLTVRDRAGNISTDTAIITVVDSIAPTVLTQNTTVYLDQTGNVTITIADINAGSSDAAGIKSITLDQTTFDATDLDQVNTVTLTVTDNNDNVATGSAIVTVLDNLAPVLSGVPIDVTVEANEVPDANTVTVTAIDNVDGSVTVSFNETRVDGANPNAYTLTRTWTATDSRGNTSSESQIISVGDTVLPTVVVQDITVYLDINGQVTITPAQIDNGSSDALGIASLVLDQTTFNQVGDFTVNLTVTDNSGNIATDQAIVTVLDNLAPTLSGVPANVTVEADAVPVAATVTAVDNADGTLSVTFTEVRTDGASPNNYTLTRTWSATDLSGNSDSATQIVTVDDTTAPTALAENITVQLDANGQATITPDQIDNGSNDTVSDITLSLDVTTFDGTDLANNGQNTVTLTVTDVEGNSAQATAIVTVEDNLAPILSGIPVDISVEADAIPAAATVTATDNVDGAITATMIETRSDGNSPNHYTLTRTWTAIDAQGNSVSDSQVITVGDTTPPTVQTQNVTVQLDSLGLATITPADIDAGSSDTVGDVSLSLDQTTFDVDDLGVNTVILTVTDEDGNSASGTATVTVEDLIAPVAIAQNPAPIFFTGSPITISPNQVNNGSSDNTGQFSLSLSQTSFDAAGDYTVTLTVTDAANNTATATAIVTILDVDLEAPEAIAQNITVPLGANGVVTITADDIDNGSTDNVGIVSKTLSQYTFTAAHLFQPNQVTLTVKDGNNNQDTATAIVTVVDELAPIVFTRNITVPLNAVGTATISASSVDNGSNDNGGIASRTLDITQFSAADLDAPVPVTLTVTDTSGNIATGTATVTVVDQSNPIANAKNITLALDANGEALITPQTINSGSADNVAIASMTVDRDRFTIDDIGVNTVTFTVIDTSGNMGTDTATITVIDNLAPIVVTQNTTLFLDENGLATLTLDAVDNGSYDNGHIVTKRLSQTQFTAANLGQPKTVTLTVTDQSGNYAANTAQVTIADNLAPTVVTQDVLLYLDENNEAKLLPSQVNNGSSDNVGIANLTLDRTDFTATDIGIQTVTLTVTDTSGNSTSQTAHITVQESGPPTPNGGQRFRLAENSPVGTFVGVVQGQTILGRLQDWQVTTPDMDRDSVPTVRIDPNTGYLWVTDVDELDFEANAEVTVNVTVSNGIERSAPMAVTLALVDRNDAPTIKVEKLYTRLSESTDTSQRVKVANIQMLDDALGSEVLAIAGTDPTPFEIDGPFLYLKAGTTLDFDAKPQYAVVLTVDDPTIGQTPDDSVLFTMGLTPVADSDSPNPPTPTPTPTPTPPSNSPTPTTPTPPSVTPTPNSPPPSPDEDSPILDPLSDEEDTPLTTDDILKGTRNKDKLLGGEGNDRLLGKQNNDRLFGGIGNDVLIGNGGRDRLLGGEGDDTLIGNRDKDKLTGGAGADTFRYHSLKDSQDIITDFSIGEDFVDLALIFTKIKGISTQNPIGNIVQLEQNGKNTLVLIDKDGIGGSMDTISLIKLNGINASNLSSSDFVF